MLKRGNLKVGNIKKAQITIFIILAVLVAGGIIAYISIREREGIEKIPANFQKIEERYLSCLKDSTEAGVGILEEQGGFIYLPDFEPGSEHIVTGSQLDFFGSGIPFWYYASGNNIIKEQAPTKEMMERQLEKYIEEN